MNTTAAARGSWVPAASSKRKLTGGGDVNNNNRPAQISNVNDSRSAINYYNDQSSIGIAPPRKKASKYDKVSSICINTPTVT